MAKIITFRKLLEAIRLNGYKQTRGTLWRENNDDLTIGSACALGQALLNLGVNSGSKLVSDIETAESLYHSKEWAPTYFVSDRMNEITTLNDSHGMTPEKIADILEKRWGKEGYLDFEIEFSEADYSYFTNYQGVKL